VARTTLRTDAVPRRSPEGNKYESGHVVVAGGSPGMTGAPCLTALAAFRADAGYVTLAGPEPALAVFESRVLEAVKRPLAADSDGLIVEDAAATVLDLAAKAGALAVGPGLGRTDGTKAFVGHAPLAPVQVSTASQMPVDVRHVVPMPTS